MRTTLVLSLMRAVVVLLCLAASPLLLGAAGKPLEPERPHLAPSRHPDVWISGNALGFLALWNEVSGSGTQVRLASVDASGARTSPITTYDGFLPSGTSAVTGGAVASGATDHLFFRLTANLTTHGVIATRVDREGRLIEEFPVGPGPTEATAVWTGADYLIATAYFDKLVVRHGANVMREIPLRPAPDGYRRTVSSARIGFDGNVALLTWLDTVSLNCAFLGCSSSESSTAMIRLSPTGSPLDSDPVTFQWRFPVSSLVAGENGSFLLATPSDQTLRIVRVENGSLTIQERSFDLRFYTISELAWNGREFVAAISAAGRYVGIARFDRNGRLIEHRAARDGRGASSVHVAASNGAEVVVAAVGDNLMSTRATAFSAADFEPLPSPPASVSRVDIATLPSGSVRATWPAAQNADGYAVEPRKDGRLVEVLQVGADVTMVERPWPHDVHVRVRAFNAGGYAVEEETRPRPRLVRR